ncbi:uncharacterized protein LOC108932086 [Scleropages formosus]|uniref:uncharacterized protein LOC108932086 n=1 Tax=Scleropages formosus TaxID=113540 RepID=UPI000878B775|nr:uncharacterized protein LOC108932086 [Scleropages formosus]
MLTGLCERERLSQVHRVRRCVTKGLFLLSGIFSAIYLIPGCKADPCSPNVLASRKTIYIPEGQSVSLSCEIQHCGDLGWKGGWGRYTENTFTLLGPTPRHLLYNKTLLQESIVLYMKILNTSRLDSGIYQCRINWTNNQSSNGHITYMNITEATPAAGRKILTRMLVCSGALLCFPVVLGVARCLCPKDTQSTDVASGRPKTEVVYAALALEARGRASKRQPPPCTIYSSVQILHPNA